MSLQSRSQKYAESAYKHVAELFQGLEKQKDKPDELSDAAKKKAKKYGSMAHKFPVLVRSAGLAQAVAFVEARGDENQRELLKHIALSVGKQGVEKFYESARKSGLMDYMHLTRQVLQASVFYKRFAESVLGIEAGEEDSDGS